MRLSAVMFTFVVALAAGCLGSTPTENRKQEIDQTINNLKQINLAIAGYQQSYRQLPQQAGLPFKNNPQLSWRVAVLPYLESGGLYLEFHHDEPWDSPHNKTLIAKMPGVFKPVGDNKGEGLTYYQVFNGPDGVFNGTEIVKGWTVTDPKNTVLVLEGKTPVIWSKPDDLPLPKEGEPMPEIGGQFKDGAYALFCDGTVRLVPANLTAIELRALAIRKSNGKAPKLPAIDSFESPPK